MGAFAGACRAWAGPERARNESNRFAVVTLDGEKHLESTEGRRVFIFANACVGCLFVPNDA